MQHAAKLNALHDLGIEMWWPSQTRHPYFEQCAIKIDLQPLQVGIQCMVLLPMLLATALATATATATTAAKAITAATATTAATAVAAASATNATTEYIPSLIKGDCYIGADLRAVPDWLPLLGKMLDVLSLRTEQIAIAKIYGHTIDHDVWQKIAQELNIWRPRAVLQFATDSKIHFAADIPVVSTLHPQHLQLHPEDKKIAYKDLLKLKAILA